MPPANVLVCHDGGLSPIKFDGRVTGYGIKSHNQIGKYVQHAFGIRTKQPRFYEL